MAKTFLQIQKQIEQLQQEAEALKADEAAGVLERIKEAIAVYGFTAADCGFGRSPKTAIKPKKAKAIRARSVADAPKFKDNFGNVWGGRGPRPAWFKEALAGGKTVQDLLA